MQVSEYFNKKETELHKAITEFLILDQTTIFSGSQSRQIAGLAVYEAKKEGKVKVCVLAGVSGL